MGLKTPVKHKRFIKIVSLLAFIVIAMAVVSSMSYGLGRYDREASLGIDIGTYSAHINVYLQRAGSEEVITIKDGVALDNAGQITTIGLNYIEGKLGDSSYANNTKFADDISLSTSSDSPAAGWLVIPSEITANGLERTSSTYASTGNGVWTISNQFTASGTHTDVQLTGLNWDETDGSTNDLLCADTFTPVTLNSGDKLTVTWTITVT